MSRPTAAGFAASLIATIAWGLYTMFLLLLLSTGPVGKDPQPPSQAEVLQGRLLLALGVVGFVVGLLALIASGRASSRRWLLASGLFHAALAVGLAALFLPDFPHQGRFANGGAGFALVPIGLAAVVAGLSLNSWRRGGTSPRG